MTSIMYQVLYEQIVPDDEWMVDIPAAWFATKSCPSISAHGEEAMPVRRDPLPGLRCTREHVLL